MLSVYLFLLPWWLISEIWISNGQYTSYRYWLHPIRRCIRFLLFKIVLCWLMKHDMISINKVNAYSFREESHRSMFDNDERWYFLYRRLLHNTLSLSICLCFQLTWLLPCNEKKLMMNRQKNSFHDFLKVEKEL